MRTEAVERAANVLVEAWRTRTRVPGLPDGCRPVTVEEAYAIQAAVARAMGGVAGWKTGASSPTAEPSRAPLLAGLVSLGPVTFAAGAFHLLGIEAEIAFRVGRDLLPRLVPYSRAEVLAALDTLHPAIEVVDSRFRDREAVDELSRVADNQSNGHLVYGAPVADWRPVDLTRQPVRLTVDGAVVAEAIGGNTGGDPLRGVEWLANHLAARGGGLRAGEIVTTGSCTGLLFVKPGAVVVAEFPGLRSVGLAFTG